MANGFVHRERIIILMEQFDRYFNRYLDSKPFEVQWVFPREGLGGAEISVRNAKRFKAIRTEFHIKNSGGAILKRIRVVLLEDNEGKLYIEVNGKLACSIEPGGRITADFLKSLAQSIKDAV